MAKKSEKTPPETNGNSVNEVNGTIETNGIGHAEYSSQNGSSLQLPELLESDITDFIDITGRLERELCTVVIGQERVIRELLLALLAGGHVLLEGVPGLGKTLLVRTLSNALNLS